ncbi:MAG: hypothetical protein KDB61_08610 [Planctomycetes bacterium]|nr:hypothetical protein [Planctomycetota bacterium]
MSNLDIYSVPRIRGLFAGLVLAGFAVGVVSPGLGVVFVIAALPPIFMMGRASHCPHCQKYLTTKSNWIGKYCKHCGEKIEPRT